MLKGRWGKSGTPAPPKTTTSEAEPAVVEETATAAAKEMTAQNIVTTAGSDVPIAALAGDAGSAAAANETPLSLRGGGRWRAETPPATPKPRLVLLGGNTFAERFRKDAATVEEPATGDAPIAEPPVVAEPETT